MDKSTLLSWPVLCALAGEEVSLPDDVAEHIELVTLSKGRMLFDIGQPHPYIHVIRQGCVKTLYRNAEGEEWVQDFLAEGAFLCSLTALLPGGVSSYACEALEDCAFERIDYAWMERTALQQLAWQRALLNGWKDYAVRRELRERDLLTLSPPERYAAFTAQRPGLAARIPQKDLARYLGITPESLSRIRGRMRDG
jgi:CRP-like cAMP-binding protein